jgi:protein-tyrosine phosphatase
MPGGFQILFVCTGNICRSATALQFLKAKLTNSQVHLDSAGTHALENAGMPPQAQQAQSELNVSPQNHVSKQLTPELLEQADLVLTATAEHRSDVVRTLVKANRYTFTMLEFAELIEFVNNPGESDFEIETIPTNLSEKLHVIASARGYLNSEKNRDIEDPFTKELSVYREVAQQIDEATTVIAKWLNE